MNLPFQFQSKWQQLPLSVTAPPSTLVYLFLQSFSTRFNQNALQHHYYSFSDWQTHLFSSSVLLPYAIYLSASESSVSLP